MSNTVQSVVQSAIEGTGYGSTARSYQSTIVSPVVNALVERDATIAATLVEKGTEMGASESDLTALMIEVGLLPEPEPVVEAADEEEIPSWAKSLISRVEALATIASDRLGVRV